MIKEFRDFINQGSVIDAAVGLILALAFKPIIDVLVANMLMPIVGRVFGVPDFSALKIGLGGSEDVLDEAGNVIGTVEPAIEYGLFINTVISFIIIAFVMFMVVKAYNRASKREIAAAGPTEVDLLTEIRDSLANR